MKGMIAYISFIFLILLIFSHCGRQENVPVLKGSYLGQEPPGKTPEIFAPGIVSTGFHERIAAFSPDGKEFYFALWGAPHGVILFMKQENNQWTKPQVVPFSGQYSEEFSLSPDGNKIVLCSNRPLKGRGEPKESYEIWTVDRNETGWGEPKNLGSIIGGYPTLSKTGNLYFTSEREGGMGESDIYMSKFVDGVYTEPENLGDSINTHLKEVDSFITPDESCIIFCRRGDGFGGYDLYISFREADGSWTKAKNMGDKINSGASEICPGISPDGKYLFFTSKRHTYKPFSDRPITYEEKIDILNSPGNGSEDIYWVSTEIIAELKTGKKGS